MNPSVAFGVGLGIFMLSALLAKQLPDGSPVWASQVVTKLTMALLSLAAIRYFSPRHRGARRRGGNRLLRNARL